jgi:branched-chain amino acid transport system substrate-binding protein
MKNHFWRVAYAVVLAGFLFGIRPATAAGDTIPIAFIAPFSGPFAPQGDAWLKMLKYTLDGVNAQGPTLGKKFELITFDDKLAPAEATIALKSALDQNIPFILQCIGSNVAAAMIDGVSKHNARNPGNRVLYLNCAALATELTEEKCDFWHFRFAANVSQRAATMVRSLPKDLKTVYLMNQDYLYGQSVQHEVLRFLAELRPDIKVVGDELVPLGKVKDFSSYVTKIKSSGAKGLITSNWGTDWNLLLKSSVEAGLPVEYFAFAAHVTGAPTAMGEAGANRVHATLDFHENIPVERNNTAAETWLKGFRDTKPGFDFTWGNFRVMFEMLRAAVIKAGSTDALKVALALEGMEIKDMVGNPNIMRASDHQLQSPFYTALFTKPVKYDSEGTGYGWRTEATVSAADLTLATSCKMKRPAS